MQPDYEFNFQAAFEVGGEPFCDSQLSSNCPLELIPYCIAGMIYKLGIDPIDVLLEYAVFELAD